MTETPKPLSDEGLAAIKKRWAFHPGSLSLDGRLEKRPDFRAGYRDIRALIATVDDATRRAEAAERAQRDAERLADKRLVDFRAFVQDVGNLSLRYQIGKDAGQALKS